MPTIHSSVERRFLFAAAAAGIMIISTLAPGAPKTPAGAASLVAEKGKFKILLEGKTVGQEEFEIAASG